MSPETARLRLAQAFTQLTTPRDTQEALVQFERFLPTGIEHAYSATLITLLGAAVRADYQYILFAPEHLYGSIPRQELSDYNNTLPTSSVVQLLFPTASDELQLTLIQQVGLGHFDHNDLLHAWAALSPEQTELKDWPSLRTHLLEQPQVLASGLLQAPELLLPEAAADAQDWLIGIYVAAFNRAPDYEGLLYWANYFAQLREAGNDRPETIRLVAREMAWSAAQHHEQGTTLEGAEFVHYYYQHVLGREPDTIGGQYWLQALESGSVPRSEFMALFLNSALHSAGDGAVVKARIAVAAVITYFDQYAPGEIDLAAEMSAIYTSAQALTAIDKIYLQYSHLQPEPPSGSPTESQTEPQADRLPESPADWQNGLLTELPTDLQAAAQTEISLVDVPPNAALWAEPKLLETQTPASASPYDEPSTESVSGVFNLEETVAPMPTSDLWAH